jgi:uncharacterized protein (TIGR02271 family)
MNYDNETGVSGSNKCLTAMFDSHADAQRAVDRLQEFGIPSARIRTVEGSTATSGTTRSTSDESKGFWDTLGDLFFPDEDRYTYAEGLSRGGYLVTVTGLSAGEYDTALDVLDDEGTVNLDEREASWRSEGWGGYESSAYAAGRSVGRAAGSSYEDRSATAGDESIPVVQESLSIGKRDTSHGRVRVRAYTVEEPVSETVELREDRVELERRPVDRAAGAGDRAFEDRAVEAETHREEAVVSKDARVVEEIGLRKTSDTRQETVSDTVRHTEVEVEDDADKRSRNRR